MRVVQLNIYKMENIESNKKELIGRVENVLNSVRPYLNADGGDIEFLELTDENVVRVSLSGTCRTCMIRVQTLKGVEHALKNAIPEIKGVVDF